MCAVKWIIHSKNFNDVTIEVWEKTNNVIISSHTLLGMWLLIHAGIKGLITVGRELRQQHPSDLLSVGQQITPVLLP